MRYCHSGADGGQEDGIPLTEDLVADPVEVTGNARVGAQVSLIGIVHEQREVSVPIQATMIGRVDAKMKNRPEACNDPQTVLQTPQS